MRVILALLEVPMSLEALDRLGCPGVDLQGCVLQECPAERVLQGALLEPRLVAEPRLSRRW